MNLEETIKRSKLEKQNQAKRFDQLVEEKLNKKPRIRKTGKHKFVSNGNTIDAIPAEKKAQAVNVENLVEAFKGTLVTDIDKMGYINFRYPGSKKIVFYCIGRKNFITVSTKNDSMASGWKSQRLTNKEELKTFVESIKAKVGGE